MTSKSFTRLVETFWKNTGLIACILPSPKSFPLIKSSHIYSCLGVCSSEGLLQDNILFETSKQTFWPTHYMTYDCIYAKFWNKQNQPMVEENQSHCLFWGQRLTREGYKEILLYILIRIGVTLACAFVKTQ